jgi:hypothetical protein
MSKPKKEKWETMDLADVVEMLLEVKDQVPKKQAAGQ